MIAMTEEEQRSNGIAESDLHRIYYDPTLSFGSEDPIDLNKTHRVLTIMLASDY